MPTNNAAKAADYVDRPFAPPLECVVDLPFPPSVNRIWRAQRKEDGANVRRSPEYRAWLQQADMCAIADRTWRHKHRMPAAFKAIILLDRSSRLGDIDNRIKCVLDWAQRSELIKNDRLCEEITARWVSPIEAPSGCRLILRSAV